MIYEKALNERTRLETELNKLKTQLKAYPEGKLICSHSGKYPKYYVSDGHTKTYIPAQNKELAEALAIKKYISTLITDYTHELTALNFYIKHHQNHVSHVDDLLSSSPQYQQLISPHFKPLSKELDEWMHSDYEKNPNHIENLIHIGSNGNYVRSKSESIIDLILSSHKYVNTVISKLHTYINHGIIPSINLITTYETKNLPLKRPYVEELIKYYFL